MEGTGGARKVRWAALGKGKRGGVRAITFYAGPDLPVFVLSGFGKGEKANLSKAECNELRSILADLAQHYSDKMG
ncbi:MAG: type II toxin-antitoxin system RelE/ParE family toxin [Alphaproteobacteria bacterium]|nr:type II toxin-antitoxin system RelE/ParE family toxin [Alphaproteobacteria bacterium]